MAQLFFNNGRARLAAAISASQTVLQLQDQVGLPTSLASGDWFLLTIALQDSRYGSNVEVVKVTAVSGNNVTVVRAHEGKAVPHNITEVVECRATAETYSRMLKEAHWEHLGNKPATATRWPNWAEVTGKPSTFVPGAHTHKWDEVEDKPAQATRWPVWNEVSSKPSTFPPSSHGHGWDQIGDKPTTATRWPTWNEVTNKPSTTASRSSTSTSILLQAKAMHDHGNSGDHDSRYYTKDAANNRFLGLGDGGTLKGDLSIEKAGTAGLSLSGKQTVSTQPVVRFKIANTGETSTPGFFEAWRRAAGLLDLDVTGFRQATFDMKLVSNSGFALENAGYNLIELNSQRTAGNIGGIGFYSKGTRKGEFIFSADGSMKAANGAYYSGNGKGLMNLPTSAIASGTFPVARLPTSDSRTSSSQAYILTSKGMNDHRTSGDHDGRYYTKAQVDSALSNAGISEYQQFTASGTWNKDPNAKWVYIEAVGGGASGGQGEGNSTSGRYANGGGGGAQMSRLLRAQDVPSSVAVTVGSGGAAIVRTATAGNAGGDSVFGSLLAAPGGGTALGGGIIEGGGYSSGEGRGDRGSGSGGRNGCNCMVGGAGGGGNDGLGGVSITGGNGGNGGSNANASNGQFPGGGGGGVMYYSNGGHSATFRSGAGGDGVVRVWQW